MPLARGDNRVAQRADIVDLQEVRLMLAHIGADAFALVAARRQRCIEIGIPLPFESELIERGIQRFAVGLQEFTGGGGHFRSREEGESGRTG